MIHIDNQQLLHIVAVHGGAGFHARSSDLEVKRALRLACKRALATCTQTGQGRTALQAVSEAIAILEDDECLNAGYGSNLTLNGTVECDASIMCGRTNDFGAIGAVSGVKNPIRLAHQVLSYSQRSDPLGRVPPLMLVSAGAADFARMHGVELSTDSGPEVSVSPRALREWSRWKGELDAAQTRGGELSQDASGPAISLKQIDELHDHQDTIGAVAWDLAGDLAAGVSSGGLLLKLPGRVGEAAIYGAGCWATHSAACSVSGTGEYITRMSLARTICESIDATNGDGGTHEILQKVLGTAFHKLCLERGEPSPQTGVLLLVKERADDGRCKPRLWCAFTTESMAVGFASTLNPKPSATILRRPPRVPGNEASVFISALPLGL